MADRVEQAVAEVVETLGNTARVAWVGLGGGSTWWGGDWMVGLTRVASVGQVAEAGPQAELVEQRRWQRPSKPSAPPPAVYSASPVSMKALWCRMDARPWPASRPAAAVASRAHMASEWARRWEALGGTRRGR